MEGTTVTWFQWMIIIKISKLITLNNQIRNPMSVAKMFLFKLSKYLQINSSVKLKFQLSRYLKLLVCLLISSVKKMFSTFDSVKKHIQSGKLEYQLASERDENLSIFNINQRNFQSKFRVHQCCKSFMFEKINLPAFVH